MMRILAFVQVGLIFFSSNCFALDVGLNYRKVNDKGQYLEFPGVTVVAAVSADHESIFEKLQHELTKISNLSDYYALLPVNSHHMTALNLYNARENAPENWRRYVTERLDWFKKIKTSFQDDPFYPQIILSKIELDRALRIVLKIDLQQMARLRAFGEKFGIPDKVPAHFHITLGYLYQEIPDLILSSMREQAQVVFERVLSENGVSNLILQEPKLCYFYNMSQFIPWNGIENPLD